MRNNEIKVHLDYYKTSGVYVITRLVGAVKVNTDITTTDHHVGATVMENEAESLARRYTVTVSPVKEAS